MLFPGCDNYSDEGPSISIYKTKGDYFYFLNTWNDKNGVIHGNPAYSSKGGSIIIADNDTIYRGRARLIDDYIVGGEIEKDNYFTNVTFKEIVAYNDRYYGITHFSNDSLIKRVIDKDPFLEFYKNKTDIKRFDYTNIYLDTMELNEIIRSGQIEKYFTLLKLL